MWNLEEVYIDQGVIAHVAQEAVTQTANGQWVNIVYDICPENQSLNVSKRLHLDTSETNIAAAHISDQIQRRSEKIRGLPKAAGIRRDQSGNLHWPMDEENGYTRNLVIEQLRTIKKEPMVALSKTADKNKTRNVIVPQVYPLATGIKRMQTQCAAGSKRLANGSFARKSNTINELRIKYAQKRIKTERYRSWFCSPRRQYIRR